MRFITALLVALLALVHAELWLSRDGVRRVVELQGELTQQRARNDEVRLTNARLSAEVRDLQEGLEMIEEKARTELGMVKPNEIMVQYNSRPRSAATAAPAAVGGSAAP